MPRIQDPKTKEDLEHNVKFQLENVVGYINIGDFESAFIKAECMMDEFKNLNKKSK